MRFRSGFAIAAVAVIAACVLAGASSAADPQPFVTVSGACPSDRLLEFPPAGHAFVVARLETQGAAHFAGKPVAGPDVVWAPVRMSPDGSISIPLYCQPDTFTLQLFGTPSSPTSFSGATTYGPSRYGYGAGSTLEFRAPSAAQYVAEVTLAQGAIELARGDDRTVVASSGSFDLGVLDAGVHELHVRPVDGPQARWTIRIRAVPVTISGVAFDKAMAKPGVGLTAKYSLTSDASLTAEVIGPSGAPVRSLGSGFAAVRGERSLRWDGLDGAGRPVPSGNYSLRISGIDAAGNRTSAEAGVLIDATIPKVSVLSPRVLPRRRGLAVRTTDGHSGLRKAILYVNRRAVASRRGPGTIIFRPRLGWRVGKHSLRVVATDSVGNVAEVTRAFRVR